MSDWRRPRGPEDLCLALFVAACTSVHVAARGGALSWLLTVPVAVLLLRRFSPSPRMRRLFLWMHWIAVGGAAVAAMNWTLYPVVDDASLDRVTAALGALLAPLAALGFAMRSADLPVGRACLPAALALLGLSWLHPARAGSVATPTVLATLALTSALALGGRAGPRRPGGALVRSTTVLLVAALVAAGIIVGLPWLQPQVERAAAALLVGDASSGLSPTSRLGDVERLALSRRIVLRAFAERPQRLRAHVMTAFDGRTWSTPGGDPGVDLEAPADSAELSSDVRAWARRLPGAILAVPALAPPSGPLVRTKIVYAGGSAIAVVPASLRLAVLSVPARYARSTGVLHTAPWPPLELYGAVNEPGAARPGDGADLAAALLVPEDLDPRVATLAARLASGHTTAAARAAATLSFLAEQYRYSLDVGAFATAQPLAEFLFEKKRGYCEYFASAAVILLRLQGVPARYVTGYNVTEENYVAGHYLVRESQAHAWIEAHLDDRGGWVELDPTPPAQFAALHESDGGDFLERVRAALDEILARLRQGDWRSTLVWLFSGMAAPVSWMLAVAAAAAALRAAWRAERRRRSRPTRHPAGVPSASGALVHRLDTVLAGQGHPRPRSRAPREHLDSLPKAALPEDLGTAAHCVVACFYGAQFAGREVSAGEIAALRRALDEAAARALERRRGT